MPNHEASSEGEVPLGVDSDVKEINRARESFFRAFNSLDIDGFTTGLADDVVLMNHNGPPPVVGKEAVRSNYKEFFEEGLFIPKLTISSDEVAVLGNWGVRQGNLGCNEDLQTRRASRTAQVLLRHNMASATGRNMEAHENYLEWSPPTN